MTSSTITKILSQKSNDPLRIRSIKKPRVSVIIPTYNHSRYIGGAIQSVLSQSYDDYEIIVVDDGSHDNTREVVAGFESKVRYIWQENGGLSAARNTGIKAAQGEIISLLDSDDLYNTNFLDSLVSLLDENSAADAVYCIAQTIDINNKPLPQLIGKVVPPNQFYETLLKGGFFPPICLVAYKYCYEKPDCLFNETLHRVEDLDLWLKFAQKYTIIGTDKVLVEYRIAPDGLSSDPERVLKFRLEVLKNHFGYGWEDNHSLPKSQRKAIGYSFLATAYEYLQLQDIDQAYYHLREGFKVFPNLLSELEVFYELVLGDQPKGYRGDFSSLNLEHNENISKRLLDRMFSDSQNSNEIRIHRHEAYANAYLALGMLSYGQRRFPKTRYYLLKAIASNPRFGFRRDLLSRFAKSFLPNWFIDWL